MSFLSVECIWIAFKSLKIQCYSFIFSSILLFVLNWLITTNLSTRNMFSILSWEFLLPLPFQIACSGNAFQHRFIVIKHPFIFLRSLHPLVHAFLTVESVLGLVFLDLIWSEACALAHAEVGQAFCCFLGVCVLHPVCSKGRLHKNNTKM